MWTCPKCGTKVDPSFEVCWKCGTTADGVEDPTFVAADAEPASDSTKSPTDLDMPEGDEPIPVPLDPAEGGLVEAYNALDLMQAKFLADKLTEAGIPAISDTQDLHDAQGELVGVAGEHFEVIPPRAVHHGTAVRQRLVEFLQLAFELTQDAPQLRPFALVRALAWVFSLTAKMIR